MQYLLLIYHSEAGFEGRPTESGQGPPSIRNTGQTQGGALRERANTWEAIQLGATKTARSVARSGEGKARRDQMARLQKTKEQLGGLFFLVEAKEPGF